METQEKQEMLVSLGNLVPGGILELPAYKAHLAKKERKVAKGQLDYRGQRELKVSRASKVLMGLLENKVPVVIKDNVEKKVRYQLHDGVKMIAL